jgi:hypothetical protein
MKRIGGVSVVALLLTGAFVLAQENTERVTAQFSDPSRPGTVKVSLLRGGMTVKASNGREVIVASRALSDQGRDRSTAPSGLRRLTQPAGLTIEEENNVMSIGVGGIRNGADLDIQVPARTDLRLNAVSGGGVVVEGIEGDIEVTNVNGSITLTDVAGSVVAHATNGKVLVTLRQVTAQKPMSFTSLNGNVDVTLPATVKANLGLRTDHGDVYTDFDVQIQPQASKPTVEDARPSGGRYRIDVDRSIHGSVNGGGPEFELRTFNGNIYVRKGK